MLCLQMPSAPGPPRSPCASVPWSPTRKNSRPLDGNRSVKSWSPLLAFPTSPSGDSTRFRAENIYEHPQPTQQGWLLRAVLRTRSPWNSATGPSTPWRDPIPPQRPLKRAKSQTHPWDLLSWQRVARWEAEIRPGRSCLDLALRRGGQAP